MIKYLIRGFRSISWIPMLLAIGCDMKKSSETMHETLDLLVGTYTDGKSEGIYHFDFNLSTGELSGGELMAKISNPSYLVISGDREFVYAVNEDENGSVTAFKWDHQTNRLDSIGQSFRAGKHPCYIDLSEKGDLIAVAGYSSGTTSFLELNELGEIDGPAKMIQHTGKGPNENRQEGPHAHCAIFSGDFVYGVDLGIDKIIAYPIREEVADRSSTAFQLEPGDGPRHLIFHPTKDYAFVVNELSNTVISLKADHENGKFEAISRVSTLPDDFSEHSQAADIHIGPEGKFLYTANRGHDSIAVFSISAEGHLERLTTESTRGEWPRNFVVTPDGNYLLVANQHSHNIVVFRIDKDTGLLTYTGKQAQISSPVCLMF